MRGGAEAGVAEEDERPHTRVPNAWNVQQHRVRRGLQQRTPHSSGEMKARLFWGILGFGAVLARVDRHSGKVIGKGDWKAQGTERSRILHQPPPLPRHGDEEEPTIEVQFQGSTLMYDREVKLPMEGARLYYQQEPLFNGSMMLDGIFALPLAVDEYGALAFINGHGGTVEAPTYFLWVTAEGVQGGHSAVMGSDPLPLESIKLSSDIDGPDLAVDDSDGLAKLKFTHHPVTEAGQNVLLAMGEIQEGIIPGHTQDKEYFLEFDSPSHSGHNTGLLVVHGWLMTISVGVMFPIGIIFPIAFKDAGPLWFQLHRAIQTVGFLAFTAGFGIGLSDGHRSEVLHLALGIASFAFAVLQVTALFFRPEKDKSARTWWNYCHWASGYTCVGLGIANIYIGLTSMGALQVDDGYTIAYSVVLGVIICCLLGSQFYKVMQRKPNPPFQVEESKLHRRDGQDDLELPKSSH